MRTKEGTDRSSIVLAVTVRRTEKRASAEDRTGSSANRMWGGLEEDVDEEDEGRLRYESAKEDKTRPSKRPKPRESVKRGAQMARDKCGRGGNGTGNAMLSRPISSRKVARGGYSSKRNWNLFWSYERR